MNTQTRLRAITKTLGVALVAVAFALTSSTSAQAATQWWQQTGGNYVMISYGNITPRCLPAGGRYDAAPGTLVVSRTFDDRYCETAVLQKCNMYVPANPSTGYLRLDSTRCKWIHMTTEEV